MRKTDIDYQGRWPFETAANDQNDYPEAAHAASEYGADDPHRAARGIVHAVIYTVCGLSLLAALVMVALGVPA